MIAVEAKEKTRTCDMKIIRVVGFVVGGFFCFLISLPFSSLKQCLNLKLGTVSHLMLQYVCKDIFGAYKRAAMKMKSTFYLWERNCRKRW